MLNPDFVVSIIAGKYREARTLDQICDELEQAGLSGELVRQARVEFERRIQSVKKMKRPAAMVRREQKDWYCGPEDSDNCWPALRRHLVETKSWDREVVRSIDKASTKVVSLLDPPAEKAFATRGIVLGYVQSGKTANFTAVIAKAADVGFKLIIVLAGIHNSLRSQTQSRLEDELVNLNKQLWHPLTSVDDDFRGMSSNADAFLSEIANQRVLCVVKKNAAVLRKLLRWFRHAQPSVLGSCPVLVIDDEADQASINTGTAEERSRINQLLHELLGTFPRCAYVGYTATPFANVLIDPSYPQGLYPKDFIVDLPRPGAYFGAERIFGSIPLHHEDDVYDDGLDLVRPVDDDELEKLRPKGQKAFETFQPELTGSLREALRWFLLASAVRYARGQSAKHMTMLVHTTLYTDVHDRFQPVLEDEIEDLRVLVGRSDAATLDSLEELWREESSRVAAVDLGEQPVAWDEVLQHLPAVFDKIKVTVDNAKSDDRLVYEDGGGVQVVVGGNTLSRGLTLEGLMVSYFLRASTTYDTLLQMGRWFGFRIGYSDLPRIWMPLGLQESFQHLAMVEAEIREDVARYEREDCNPLDFGVRIRTHSTLAVTSRMKMQHAVNSAMSFSGGVKQTTCFEASDAAWLTRNVDAGRELLRVAEVSTKSVKVWGRHLLWRNVGVAAVREFLSRYQVHEQHVDMQNNLLLGYIAEQNEGGKLLYWNIAVVGQSKTGGATWSGLLQGGESVPLLTRSKMAGRDVTDVKAIMSMTDRAIDFGLDKAPTSADAGDKSLATWTDEKRSPLGAEEDAPDPKNGLGMPLLLLYPINKDSQPSYGKGTGSSRSRARESLDAVEHVLGLAVVFPRAARLTAQSYVTVDLSNVEREDWSYEDEE